MLMVRIRSCHVTGSFRGAGQQAPAADRARRAANPRSDYARVVLPPMSYMQEQDKINNRWPAAQKYIRENKLNEISARTEGAVGIVFRAACTMA
jgi:indolepyruvate ferredoxin oxidoreductase alpha subunit